VKKPKRQTIDKNDNYTYTVDPSKKETTPGLFVSAGEISEDYDKVTWKELLEDYTNMRNGGAIESSTVSILKYPIMRAGYSITHEVKEVEDYCKWVFTNLSDSFGNKNGIIEFINHIFLALDFGCSFFEKIYESGVYDNAGKITNIISRLAPFKLETIWEFHYNDLMQFSGIRHERRQANSINTFIDIPIDKLFFYSHNSEFGDPRGRSELRPIRNLFKIKKDILLATARAQQRGAGIPEIKVLKSAIKDEDKKNAIAIGKSIGNMKSGYIVTDQNVEVKLHSLQIQGSPENTLEFINREMFFNTLTEFMSSGIGQNGSRSATSEHKSSYELKCGVVTQDIEACINNLLKEIIDLSYFAGLKEYPVFKFNSMQQTDIVTAASAISSLYQNAILVKQEGDEQYIRSLFNMPDKKLVNGVEVVNQIKLPDNVNNVTNVNGFDNNNKKLINLDNKKISLKLSAEDQTTFLDNTFDAKGAENMYIDKQIESENIIKDVIKKYSLYIAKQIDAGQPVEMKYNTELANRLNKLYRDCRALGNKAVITEMQKVAGKKELASEIPVIGDTVKTSSQSITRFAGRLMFNVKTVVEDQLDTDWQPSKSSAVDYVISKEFENGFKTDTRTLIQKTVDGYLDGRAETLTDNADNIELYFYNAILDTRLCDTCAVFHGSVATAQELETMGIQLGRGRVNDKCLGGLWQCRCNVVPYKLKGDFKI
jgi:hypothetical protein